MDFDESEYFSYSDVRNCSECILKLEWKTSYNKICKECKKPNLSRFYCPKCNFYYCVFCMKPPQFGDKCPLGHSMSLANLFSHSCDVCRKSISRGYRDPLCDFDVCEKCRKNEEFIRVR